MSDAEAVGSPAARDSRRVDWTVATLSVVACVAVAIWGAATLVPVLIGVVAAAALTRPSLGILGFALLVPFDAYLPAFQIYKDLLWSDVLMLAVLAATARRYGVGGPVSLEHALAIAALVALGALQTWSLVLAFNWMDGLDNVLRFAYYGAFLLLLPRIVDVRLARAITAALIAGTLCRFTYEAVPYFSNAAFVLHPSNQFGGWTSNPNTLAGRAAPVVAFAFAWMVSARRGLTRAAATVASALICTGLLLSFSKGAWVAAAAALSVWVLLSWRSIGTHRVAAAAAAVLLMAVFVPQIRLAPHLIVERWTSAASTISNQERLRYLAAAWQMTLEHPLGGVGLEQFPDQYRKLAKLSTGGPEDPHNAYLHIASELGVPALGVFMMLLGAWLAAGLRAYVESADKAFPGAIVASLVAICVLQLFSSEPWNWRGFWLLALLPWSFGRSTARRPTFTPASNLM